MVDVRRDFSEEVLSGGIVSGVIAGFFFLLAQAAIDSALGGSFASLVRLPGRLVLPAANPVGQSVVGILLHTLIFGILGALFMFVLLLSRQVSAPRIRLVVWGSIYGFIVWWAGSRLVSPGLFPQEPAGQDLWTGFVAYTFFFGAALGALVRAPAVGGKRFRGRDGQRNFYRQRAKPVKR